jgi:hypothetical protein
MDGVKKLIHEWIMNQHKVTARNMYLNRVQTDLSTEFSLRLVWKRPRKNCNVGGYFLFNYKFTCLLKVYILIVLRKNTFYCCVLKPVLNFRNVNINIRNLFRTDSVGFKEQCT